MLDMHTDMSGSAVALATLVALARAARADLAADAWLAITENNTGPSAYRPQEVVRAEQRHHHPGHSHRRRRAHGAGRHAGACRHAREPRLIIDFATLTGACVYALTERISGIFTNRPAARRELLEAGRRSSGERVWNFPFDEDYDSDLESKVADIMQCALEGKGDHILAARFLSRFVPRRHPWVHVDLAAATRAAAAWRISAPRSPDSACATRSSCCWRQTAGSCRGAA